MAIDIRPFAPDILQVIKVYISKKAKDRFNEWQGDWLYMVLNLT